MGNGERKFAFHTYWIEYGCTVVLVESEAQDVYFFFWIWSCKVDQATSLTVEWWKRWAENKRDGGPFFAD